MSNLLQDKISLLPKHAKGLAVVHLIKECLEHPSIFVYGELLDLPNVLSLKDNPETESWLRLIDIFAFGVYRDYRVNHGNLPQLTPAMISKLRALTIVTMAEKNKRLPYLTLVQELEMDDLRSLEDLIIEVIYTKAIEGKMDQKNGWLEIESTIGRDIKRDQLESVAEILSSWCNNCDNVLSNIESQISHANHVKAETFNQRQELDAKIHSIKSSLKPGNISSHILEYEDELMQTQPSSQSGIGPGSRSEGLMERTKRKFARKSPFTKSGMYK